MQPIKKHAMVALAFTLMVCNTVFAESPMPSGPFCHISDIDCILESKVCSKADTICISYPNKLPGLHWYFWPKPPWNIGATSKDSVVAELSSEETLYIRGKGNMMNFSAEYSTRPWDVKLGKNIEVVIENGVTSIGNEAFAISRVTSITIPGSVTFIGNYSLCSLNEITSITIPSGVTSFGEKGAFFDCGQLEAINVASDNKKYSSKDGVLYDKNFNTLIRSPEGKSGTAIIPDGVTSIGDYAFHSSSLTSITIPSSVTYIGEAAFAWSSIGSITILNPAPPLFNDTRFFDTLYVPKGSVDAYSQADGWKDFKNIKPIE